MLELGGSGLLVQALDGLQYGGIYCWDEKESMVVELLGCVLVEEGDFGLRVVLGQGCSAWRRRSCDG